MHEADIAFGVERQDAVGVRQVLGIVKQEMREMSEQEAKLVDLGTLSGGHEEHLWNGSISLKERLGSGEITPQEVDNGLAQINAFFVQASEGAAKRCIDGSTIESYDDKDPRWFGRALGPQIQGGTVDEAVAVRLVEGVRPGANLREDINKHVSESSSKYAPGDHTDDRASEDNTGCGAITGQRRKLQMYNDVGAAQIIQGTTEKILGLADIKPPFGAWQKLQKSAKQLLVITDYFPKKASAILDQLQAINPNGVEKLIRPHSEVSLTLNFVKGTTFHRDHYNALTDSKIQNFNLDIWAILEEFNEEEGYALIADAVATAMDLTDGTLRLFARLPSEELTTK